MLSLSVTSNNHLVEIKGDTECPQEVGDKVVVNKDSNGDAHPLIIVYIRLKRYQECRKTNYNTHAEIHDKLDWIGSQLLLRVDTKSYNNTESTNDGKNHKY